MAGTSEAVNRLNWAINGDGLALAECWAMRTKHEVNMAMPEMQIAISSSFLENTQILLGKQQTPTGFGRRSSLDCSADSILLGWPARCRKALGFT
jgi:hypothetical protein